MATVIKNDGTSFETPDENIANVERLLGASIKEVVYESSPLADAVNELAAKQAAMWQDKKEEKQKTKGPKAAKK